MSGKYKGPEKASKFIRVYPTDYVEINKKAQMKRTTAGQIIHEALQKK